MIIEITAPGIYNANGAVPVGTKLEVGQEPVAWTGKYRVADASDKGGKGLEVATPSQEDSGDQEQPKRRGRPRKQRTEEGDSE